MHAYRSTSSKLNIATQSLHTTTVVDSIQQHRHLQQQIKLQKQHLLPFLTFFPCVKSHLTHIHSSNHSQWRNLHLQRLPFQAHPKRHALTLSTSPTPRSRSWMKTTSVCQAPDPPLFPGLILLGRFIHHLQAPAQRREVQEVQEVEERGGREQGEG